jgi:hypothetical protein
MTTELVIARRDGILREPNGTQHRIFRGKTLADARHPGVVASPDTWMSVTIDLPVEDTDAGEAGTGADELRARLGDAEAAVESYKVQLTRVVMLLEERGMLPADTDREQEGWLVNAVAAAFDELEAELEPVEPVAEQPVAVQHEPAAELADPETPEGRAAIRTWAWANGHDVSERGQLPRVVVDAHRSAHGG